MKHKILLVDDEPANLRMLERFFRDEYDPISAESGAEALDLLSHNDVALIISDQRMPGMTGIEFLKRAAQMRQHTVRIVLTGYTDIGDLVEAINSGVVYKYITKPWVNTDLSQTVRRAVEYYETSKKQHLAAQENERLERRMHLTVQGFVIAVREMIAQKHSNLAEHCRRTSEYAALIGQQFGIEPDDMEKLIFASLLHEVPNMRLPFEMNISKASLTPDQYRMTNANYENGVQMILNVPDLEEVATIIRYQHEHFDGTGFFSGLLGDAIPLASRILSVANAFDEINSGRNPALMCTDDEVADWMRERAGTEFDPQVVEVCLSTALVESTGMPKSLNSHLNVQSQVSAARL